MLALALLVAATTPPHALGGIVRDIHSHEPVARALVVLQCDCMAALRETATNATGAYYFGGLASGTYLITVFAGEAEVSYVVTLPRPDVSQTRERKRAKRRRRAR